MSRKSEFRTKFSSIFGNQRAGFNRQPPEEFNLDNDTLNELGKGHLPNRLKILKQLSEKIEEKRLEKNGIESLWVAIQDIAKDGPVDARHNVIGFLCSLVSNQYSQLGSMRQTLFQYIKSCNYDDLEPCFNLLVSLTSGGCDIQLIEEQIGGYIIQLLPRMIAGKKMMDVLVFLGNMTKTNATYVDTALLSCVFDKCCNYTVKQPIEDIRGCINYIEVAVQYAIIPPSSVPCLMMYICSVRCIIPKAEPCSNSLKKVMGMLISNRSLEHTIIYTMCSFLEETPSRSFVGAQEIQRSTMYLLSTTLWNRSRGSAKQHFCSSVLTSIHKVIQGKERDVIVEVLQSLQYYINNHSTIMEHLTWDAMLAILEEIVMQQKERKFEDEVIVKFLNSMMDEAEELYTEPGYYKCKDRFYEIIELCVDIRPPRSIKSLMANKERLIVPGVLSWCANLLQFMQDFYHTSRPEIIRLNALEKCWGVVDQFYQLYEEELLEQVVLKVLESVHTDPNTKLRHRAVQFLIQLCYRCSSEKFYDIINIILKVISVVVQINDERESILICDELITLFLHKVSRTPSRHALFIFDGLVKLANGFYSPHFTSHFQSTAKIRYKILDCLFSISISSAGETIVYLPHEGSLRYRIATCPFFKISVSDTCIRPQQVTPHKLELELPEEATGEYDIVPLPYDHVDNLIYHCLNTENDWPVVKLTLSAIKKRLCNAQLQTYRNLDSLTSQLVDLLDNKERLQELHNIPKEYSPSDIKSCIFPVIVRLIPYQARIYQSRSSYRTTGETDMSRKLLDALIHGLKPKFAKVCIEGLTVAALELTSLIIRPLNRIIREISRIAAGRTLAIATLAFLSTLAQTPAMYKNFTEEEYKVVISVILPYTDPDKFEVYTIHFAHVVVCNWYVRCHYKHRPAFKEYILSQLRSTVKSVDRKPRSDSNSHASVSHSEHRLGGRKISTESKDSRSLRPRSGDYGRLSGSNTPRSSFKRNSSIDSMNKAGDTGGGAGGAGLIAHNQLIDVTEDLLERWMFSGRCNIIKKSPQMDLLFSNKKMKTWAVGKTLITISTAQSCDSPSSEACQRCRMVQAIMGEGSFGGSPETSQEYVSKIPIPGTRTTPTIDLNKIMTPKCSCWCRDFAHVEIRSPTSNSSIILRLQNKCHLVRLDAAAGGDSHVLTSLFDDDLSQLLDVHCDYTPQQLENMLYSTSSSSGSKKHNITRRRRLSTPEAGDEMTPTMAIEVRQRSHSDLGITEKSDPLKEPFVDPRCGKPFADPCEEPRRVHVDICEQYTDKSAAFTQAGVDEAFDKTRRRSNHIFKYAKSTVKQPGEIPRVASEGDMNSANSKDSTPFSSPRPSMRREGKSPVASWSGSSQDLLSRSSSLKDCSKFSVDSDRSHWDIDPSFIFRQLYPLIAYNAENMPLSLPDTEDLSRSLKLLDHIMVSNTHKIGVIYVGPGQSNEVAILRNTYGSVRYVDFFQSLGDMIWLANCDQSNIYVGGLDTSGVDGDYTVSWRDKTSQVVFHVATLMPQHDTDPTSTNKKRHIGNNFVTIVYNDSGLPYQQGTIKGQCNFCDIVIEPLPSGMNLISFISTTKTVLTDLKPHGRLLVNDKPLPTFIRQLAVNANGLCQVIRGTGTAYSCNWLERLKKIEKLVSRSTTPISSPTPTRRETFY